MKLTITNLIYRYKSNKEDTLNGVSLTLESGKVTTLLGPNGCGKTTLVKCLLGVLKGEGSIYLDEKDLSGMPMKERNNLIGYLPQEQPSTSSLSVFEVILLGDIASLGLKPSNEALERVKMIIQQFHLEHIAMKKYSQLSGGERRIVNIAQVMLKNPKILILDEPTANLDIANELEILDLISHYVKKKNILCLMVLHSINMAARYSDHLCLLKDGKVYKWGSPKEVITEGNIKSTYHVIVQENMSIDGYPTIHLLKAGKEKEYDF